MYLRLQDAREQRLRVLTKNIRSAHANKPKGGSGQHGAWQNSEPYALDNSRALAHVGPLALSLLHLQKWGRSARSFSHSCYPNKWVFRTDEALVLAALEKPMSLNCEDY